MRKLIVLLFLSLSIATGFSQPVNRPKLVVGIVIDQMRWDYLYRFSDRMGKGGFNRLLNDGFSCEQTFIPYLPTHTAPGHAAIYTGSVPALHGIVGNSWYVKSSKSVVYCVEDTSVRPVGTTSTAGKMSPRNLWANTVTDELRLATNFRNKTIAIALKDRGSVLPGGHTANAAYWFDNLTGGWISSNFYINTLPDWVKKFNDRKLADEYMKNGWTTMYPINTYLQSSADSNRYEGAMSEDGFVFPHKLSDKPNNHYESFRTTPYGNTITFDMAKAAVEGEHLGESGQTDFLAISCSSTDYIGHTYGPNSVEIEDTYLRLDQDLAAFLKYLDTKIGKGQYLCFLTADHGAAHNPNFLIDNKIPAGSGSNIPGRSQLNDSLAKYFGVKNLVIQSINYQLFLNDSLIKAQKMDSRPIREYISSLLIKNPAISSVIDLDDIPNAVIPEKIRKAIVNSYNPRFTGDLLLIYKPEYFESLRLGTTHGLWNPYDSHIPLLFYGWHVPTGRTNRETYITDIAPTISTMLHIQMPNASVGTPVFEVTDKDSK